MRRARWVAAVILLVTGVGVAVLQAQPASAHGAMMAPGSRTYLCWKDGLTANGAIQPRNAACAAAVAQGGTTPLYNWFAVLRSDGAGRTSGFIPDGQLCSGGTGGPYDFTGFNLARDDWPVTHLTPGASMRFDYNNWAKHPGTFSLYITKDGWSPGRPLAWNDLEPAPFSRVTDPASVGGPGTADGRYSWTADLPSGKTGRHLIYSVWSRSDSAETFYGCSDVVFDGGDGEVTGVGDGTTPPSPPPGNGGCSAMYSVIGGWGGGFQAEIMVHAGDTPVTGWTVSWTFPGAQAISQLWNGRYTASGSSATVRNETYNGSIAAGGHTTFGFLGAGAAPASLTDLTCTTT
ncbi:lytic polysaccharide monooxygenase [Actinoplanes sp. NPDC049681]|uniref:lytic polysaccharide monooxygenase auxiliary activity family 9 protein n=1 Tax=Actinoplanes sp. NPDC049681 TaxID=3363905 RepID=UPI00378D8C5A